MRERFSRWALRIALAAIVVGVLGPYVPSSFVETVLQSAASFPAAVKSFTTKSNGSAVQASHINDLQDEVTAIEQDLYNGLSRVRLGSSTLTIASDAVTVTKSLHAVDTEGAASTDNLSTISAGSGVGAGHLLTLYAANVSHVVTVKDSVGNITLFGGDYAMDSAKKSILLRYDGTNWVEIARAAPSVFARGCDVRLTLTSGTPVTTTDVTGATTVYATPYVRDGGGPAYCTFYDGSSTWSPLPISEVSIALGTLTSGLPYDIFCYSNGGVFACDAPVAWTSTTARATALATQNGVYVKTGATTRRYIGTFYTSSTTATEDSAAKSYLWNYYNRVPRRLGAFESTNSWAYTTATYRQANGASTNQLDVVVGVAEDAISVSVSEVASNTSAGVTLNVGIGYDSTTTPITASFYPQVVTPVINFNVMLVASAVHVPAAGRHTYVWLEKSAASGTTTWNGNVSNQSGISGLWKS